MRRNLAKVAADAAAKAEMKAPAVAYEGPATKCSPGAARAREVRIPFLPRRPKLKPSHSSRSGSEDSAGRWCSGLAEVGK
jgi:hypothetical protein